MRQRVQPSRNGSRHLRVARYLVLLSLFLFAPALAPRLAASGREQPLVVSPAGPFQTIQAALEAAHDGDTIRVQRAQYAGPIVVTKSVTLEGVDRPIIDNGGKGTIATLAAPGIVFRGFELRGSGSEPDQDHSGIIITAPHVTAEDNRLTDVLFGIYVAQAPDAVVRGNEITSKSQYEIARRGDAIRLWYSPRAEIQNNHVYGARDLVIWYSTDAHIQGNTIEHGRYGIHLMYCDGADIEQNRIRDNSVGIYTMYSNNVVLRENWIQSQRGPSGYALGFKDTDNIQVTQNVLSDNRAGIYMDGMPFSPQGYGRVHDNILAFNDVGIIALPAVRGNTIERNTFWENVEQVAVQGSGNLGPNVWKGNYWSDYAAYDADGNGKGDVPYRAERMFEGLTDRHPMLRMLIYSPAQQAVEFAAAAFPLVKPKPKLTDTEPSTQPNPIPSFAVPSPAGGGSMALSAIALFALGGGIYSLARRQGKDMEKMKEEATATGPHPSPPLVQGRVKALSPMGIEIRAVSKRYGRLQALDDVSFTANPGEALALWGPNGAGKTTLLKAILGLVVCEGKIIVNGRDVQREPKLARRNIGYVPQEAAFYDLTVAATVDLYTRLKKSDPSRAGELVQRVGLGEHLHKPVSALSGGLKQRLALAIALLSDPPVLLLDEPTANLDSHTRHEYLTLLASLHHDGKTILFASHRIEEVVTLADRAIFMTNGRIDQVLGVDELQSRLAPEVVLTLWIPEIDRARALARLQREGLSVRLNGRGTVVIQVRARDKMHPLDALHDEGIRISDLAMEGISSWN